jgi:hypothetical protein
MRYFASEFHRRVWFAHHVGSVRKMSGHYLSIPLYHRRPPAPFEPKLTRTQKIELDHWIKAIKSV